MRLSGSHKENLGLLCNASFGTRSNLSLKPPARAGLNEREAPGKVVTARPPKSLAQLRSAGVPKRFDPRAKFATAWSLEGRMLCDLRNICKKRC